jgi:FkbM family methyltransferase
MPDNFIASLNRYKQKIMLNPEDVIGKTILKEGIYDRTGLYFIEKILSQLPSPIVFDIGASIGNHALRMALYSKMVYLFEPQTELAQHLATTQRLNQLTNWKIFNLGLSDENKTLTLYKNLISNIETSFVAELKGKDFSTEEASVRIGDEIVHENALTQLDFIKIDVEGFEAPVLTGLKNSILKFRPLIFMEWDKTITKQQFQERHLFSEVLKDYDIKAIIRNPEENSFFNKCRSRIKRFFSPNKIRKRRILGDFQPEANYRHLVLVPQEKIGVIQDL